MKYQRIKDKFFYFNYLFYDFKFIGNKHLISYSRSDKIALFQPVAKRIYIYRKKKEKRNSASCCSSRGESRSYEIFTILPATRHFILQSPKASKYCWIDSTRKKKKGLAHEKLPLGPQRSYKYM